MKKKCKNVSTTFMHELEDLVSGKQNFEHDQVVVLVHPQYIT